MKDDHPYTQEDLARIIDATQMKSATPDLQEFSTVQSERVAIIVLANRDDLCPIDPMISDNLKQVIRPFIHGVWRRPMAGSGGAASLSRVRARTGAGGDCSYVIK